MGLDSVFGDKVLVNQRSSISQINKRFSFDLCSIIGDDGSGKLKGISRFARGCFSESRGTL